MRKATIHLLIVVRHPKARYAINPQRKNPPLLQPMQISPKPSCLVKTSHHSIEHDRFIEEVEVRARQTMAGLREFGRRSCSDTDAGLAPMPPLRVVPIPVTLVNAPLYSRARE